MDLLIRSRPEVSLKRLGVLWGVNKKLKVPIEIALLGVPRQVLVFVLNVFLILI